MAFEVIYRLDGKIVSRSEFRRRSKGRKRQLKSGEKASGGARGLGVTLRPQKQIVSEAMACHPMDAEAFEQDAKKRGFNIHFCRRTGRPTFTSFSQRDAYIKTQGYHVRSTKRCPL